MYPVKNDILITIFFLAISTMAFSQETVEVKKYFYKSKQISEVYYVLKKDKNIKHGDYVSYYPLAQKDIESYLERRIPEEEYINEKGQ
jgi:hypothetical protein